MSKFSIFFPPSISCPETTASDPDDSHIPSSSTNWSRTPRHQKRNADQTYMYTLPLLLKKQQMEKNACAQIQILNITHEYRAAAKAPPYDFLLVLFSPVRVPQIVGDVLIWCVAVLVHIPFLESARRFCHRFSLIAYKKTTKAPI